MSPEDGNVVENVVVPFLSVLNQGEFPSCHLTGIYISDFIPVISTFSIKV